MFASEVLITSVQSPYQFYVQWPINMLNKEFIEKYVCNISCHLDQITCGQKKNNQNRSIV